MRSAMTIWQIAAVAALLGAACLQSYDDFSFEGATGGGAPGSASSSGGAACNAPSDCPSPETTCQVPICEKGTCATTNEAAGEPCAEAGGDVCDDAGACVECNEPTDCGGAPCVDGRCQLPPGCTDGRRSGTETGIDCGGGACPACPNGMGCAGAGDCLSGFCDVDACAACAMPEDCAGLPGTLCQEGVCTPLDDTGDACANDGQCTSGMCRDMVCCASDCAGVCEACAAALTGQADGTCAPVLAATDPDGDCAGAARACDGTGMCGDCGGKPDPPGQGACPAICNGGCDDDVCVIDCGLQSCANETRACPDDYACQLLCQGNQVCRDTLVLCPSTYACEVECEGTQSCRDIDVGCADGLCSITCDAGNACNGASVTCSSGACLRTCLGDVAPAFDCSPVTACACVSNGC